MKKYSPLQTILLVIAGIIVVVCAILYALFAPRGVAHAPISQITQLPIAQDETQQLADVGAIQTSAPTPAVPVTTTFVGPRDNVPKDAPVAYGFWSFAIPINGVISRSGQPLMSEFTWLKENGWKGDINLRMDGEYGDAADDAVLPGFAELGFNYLHIPIIDGHAPTDDQAKEFLAFVTNTANQPVHIHCRGGYGRAGTMMALYRYAVQGWPVEQAIAESRLFHGGISDVQAKWLTTWAKDNAPGSYK